MLPAPVPGLAGPALGFVGEIRHDAAPAPARARTESPKSAPSSPVALDAVKARSRVPAIPGEPNPGASAPAIVRDRDEAGSTTEDGASPTGRRAADESSNAAGGAAFGRAGAETAAGEGRRFFDQGSVLPGLLDDGAASAPRRERVPGGGDFGAGGHAPAETAAWSAGYAFRSGASASGSAARFSALAPAAASGGEVLRDAVAAPFVPAAAGARAVAFGAVAPNGELAPASAAAGLPGPSAPRPLALDLSGSGLVVRVRSALSSALPSAFAPEPPAAALPVTTPSTALLERGGLLEAFSVARAASVSEPAGAPGSGLVPYAASRSAPRPAPLAPSPAPVLPSAWWALLALPLLLLAGRSIL